MSRTAPKPPHCFYGVIVADSARALLFHSWTWTEPRWLPKSQVELFNHWPTVEVCVKVSEWICNKNGLDEMAEPTVGAYDGD